MESSTRLPDPGAYLPDPGAHPLLRSAVGGAVAYVAGILAVAILNPVDGDGADPIAFAANRFYSAQFVGIDRAVHDPESSGIHLGAATSPAVDASELSPFVFYAIPIAVLLLAGYWIARRNPAEEPEQTAVLGAASVFGYLPLTILGAVAITATWSVGSGEITATPDLELWTVLVMGIGYPLAFGGIGGAIAGRS